MHPLQLKVLERGILHELKGASVRVATKMTKSATKSGLCEMQFQNVSDINVLTNKKCISRKDPTSVLPVLFSRLE